MTSCGTSGEVVRHAFEFDALVDSPDAYILDYRYGSSQHPSARNPESLLKQGQSLQSANISGPMRRGNDLYVKWRIKSTRQTYEETVDLLHRLPPDIENCRIYFRVEGAGLYVYLISPQRNVAAVNPNLPKRYADRIVTTIYPDR